MHRITKGLDVPVSGEPTQSVQDAPEASRVAILGPDYVGMKPTMRVEEGDSVAAGQILFEDKKTPGVVFTAPVAGKVAAVNRGARRALQSVVIERESEAAVEFKALAQGDLESVDRQALVDVLVESGLWTSLRTRPFSRTPSVESTPRSIFVQAIDTNPLAADPTAIIREREQDFRYGLQALTRLTDGPVYCCRRPAVPLAGEDHGQVTAAEFEGPHPAGLPGTHIHLLDPVGPGKSVWTINYQDVLAIGRLLTTGRICPERVISVAGPAVEQPGLLRTTLGANTTDLLNGRLGSGEHRVVSGSLLSGRAAADPLDFLGRFHLQISVIAEEAPREFLGWLAPGSNRFSLSRAFTSALNRSRKFAFNTSAQGSPRAMVPIGLYEKVMPLDILPTFLLRALMTDDTDQAQALGCLELDEEDLALCTFVCPGKTEYGPILRRSLTKIELDG